MGPGGAGQGGWLAHGAGLVLVPGETATIKDRCFQLLLNDLKLVAVVLADELTEPLAGTEVRRGSDVKMTA
jgi:hypothetical protein